jgi:hypothetical protein
LLRCGVGAKSAKRKALGTVVVTIGSGDACAKYIEKLYNSKFAALADPHGTGITDPWMATSYSTMMAASTAIEAGYGATKPNRPGKNDVRYWVDQLN